MEFAVTAERDLCQHLMKKERTDLNGENLTSRNYSRDLLKSDKK